ncbi:MAG TPA: FliI/YscN family ATPase [Steroidobacteraceae bacterium]|nr:FliI/YscN family ATPase [Steroidobacteraceae bacterium]
MQTAKPLHADYLAAALDGAFDGLVPLQARGRVIEAIGTMVRAKGMNARVGDVCELRGPDSSWRLHAEVVGMARDSTLLMPFGELQGISSEIEVINLGQPPSIKVGDALLGRVLDGFGQPLDDGGPIPAQAEYPIHARAPHPLARRKIDQPLWLGVRAIDGLLTCGVGQRLGIFAPAGVGKSSLLHMIAQGAQADIAVIGLIGERGREVGEFVQHMMATPHAARCVYVVATSDRPAVERAKAAGVATAVAEYFRDQGRSVLLLVDSITRYARALRDIGLATGEPPTRRGYPPSVFAALPRLFERAGQSDRGAITAFYTVLVDDEETSDPIGEEARATLDGHIVLARPLAAANHYPAIDIGKSRSRVMQHVAPADLQDIAGQARQLLAKYESIETLLQIGEYRPGNDPAADRAVRCIDALRSFLKQRPHECADGRDMATRLREALHE